MSAGYAALQVGVKGGGPGESCDFGPGSWYSPPLMQAEPATGPDGAPPFDPDAMASRIPTERRRDGSWARRCARTLVGMLVAPHRMFERCPEPVDHGTALRYLATLRLVPWLGLIGFLALSFTLSPEREVTTSRSIHAFVDPALVESLSVWLLVMVPVGMPLLYFVCGVVSHVAVGLTGIASRSVGASMRATGYAMAPALLGVGLLDVPLYTSGFRGVPYMLVVGVLVGVFWVIATIGLSRTHQINPLRAFIVAALPTVMLAVVFDVRAALLLQELPLLPEPPSPYVVP